MGPGLEVQLLGEMRVCAEGEPVAGLRSGRARSLLAYLVLQPDVAHPRRRLASTFWPESSESQSRTNLRNVLHALRKTHPAVDDAIVGTATTLQWRRDPTMAIDVERFVDAADAAVGADPDQVHALVELSRAALAEYGGDLLAGEHDEWLAARREELRHRYQRVLRVLITALVDDGRGTDAVPLARELVRSDPLDESAHRLRMEAHQVAGDRAGAVRAYHECVTTLDRELGVPPDPTTVATYASLLERVPRSSTASGGRKVSVGHPLTGRSTEIERLHAAWLAARHGGPRLALVTGEAGIGKTRLVEELRTGCTASGALIGEARSYEREGDLGYAVAASWLRSPDVRAGTRGLTAAQTAELARLLPELGIRGATPSEGGAATRKRRLLDATVAALTAAGRPTLLLVDDAQWSDRASLELMHYLLRQPIDHPLLVVLTARSEDLDPSHPLVALRDSLATLDRLDEVRLERLSPVATGALGAELLGSPLDAAGVDALHAESEGNPLFVVETIRAGWDGTGPAGMTPRLRAVIESRFRRLSDTGSTVLSSAAVVGRPCSAALLGRTSGLDDRSLVVGLDELWQRGILQEVGVDAYDFSHGKLRDAAYDALAPAIRRTLHGEVADALVALSDRDGPPASSQVAFHQLAANRTEEAVTWFQRAADDAYRVHAYSEALSALDRALGLVPALPAGVRHRWELELLSALPATLAGVDGYGTERMTSTHRRATDVAADLGVELQPAFVRSMVMSALCRDEFADARVMAGRLASAAEATGDHALLMESHYLLGISAFWSADLDGARGHFEAVVAGFDDSARAHHHLEFGHDPQVVCLSRLANTLWFLGEDEPARLTGERALELAEEVRHPLSHDTAVIFAGVLAVDLGDHSRLRELEPRLGALGLDSVPHAMKHEAVVGLLSVVDGRHEEGLRQIRTALDRCGSRNFYPGFRMTVHRLLLAAHAIVDEPEAGLRSCTDALALHSTPLWDAEAHRLRAVFLQRLGTDPSVVHAELDRGEVVARHQGAEAHLRRLEATRRDLVSA